MADVGSKALFDRLLRWTNERAPTGTTQEFLAFAGTVGLGRLAAAGDERALKRLKALASDPRWRVREAVAMALQRVGAVDMPRLVAIARRWATGSHYERRAAAAGLCEPPLLKRRDDVSDVLAVLDVVTGAVATAEDRRAEDLHALRKALGYCWSVAVAASPAEGRKYMERWMGSDDPDVRWIMRENLSKKRIRAAGDAWVETWSERLSPTTS